MGKFCTECGEGLPDQAKFCSECGTPVDRLVSGQVVNVERDVGGNLIVAQQVILPDSEALRPVRSAVQSYGPSREAAIVHFFERLKAVAEANIDLGELGDSEEIQQRFHFILDRVALAHNREKVERWKNAAVHLATDFRDFDFTDNFLRTLDDLTVFDLTVLERIYSASFFKEHFGSEVRTFFTDRGVPLEIVLQSLKRLASHNLIDERFDRTAHYAREDGEPSLTELFYTKNNLGPEFIRFISDIFADDNAS